MSKSMIMDKVQSLWSETKWKWCSDEVHNDKVWWWHGGMQKHGDADAKMQRQNMQHRDTRHNAGCSVQWTQTIGNANDTKGATPQTQPLKCAKCEQRQRHKGTGGRVWSLRQIMRMQLSANKRLRHEEEGERNLFFVKGYRVYIVLCWSKVAGAKMVKYETELTLQALFSYMVRCVLH